MIDNNTVLNDIVRIYNEWIMLFQRDISILEYFYFHKYKKIAVYGMGEVGKRLTDELAKDPELSVVCVDKDKMKNWYKGKAIIRPDKLVCLDVDVVVVTAISYYEVIINELVCKTKNIVSLEDIIYECN